MAPASSICAADCSASCSTVAVAEKECVICDQPRECPAIPTEFTNLVILELGQRLANFASLPRHMDPSSLMMFPSVRELRISNNYFEQFILDEAHYPQLRSLFVKDAWFVTDQMKLQLNLPLLLNLGLEEMSFPDAASLSACLSSSACPRLRRFCGHDLALGGGPNPRILDLDMAWLQDFELEDVNLMSVVLRAPRLLRLRVTKCEYLDSVVLLPDGEPTPDDVVADAADAEVVIPDGVPSTWNDRYRVSDNVRMSREWGDGCERRCVPCEDMRIDITVRDAQRWQRCWDSNSYTDLCEDSRIRSVDAVKYTEMLYWPGCDDDPWWE